MADLDVSFSVTSYAANAQVLADVNAVGTVTIESDFAKRSFPVDVMGQTQVQLGQVTDAGVFVVTFRLDDKVVRTALLVVPDDGGAFQIQPAAALQSAVGTVSADLLTRLHDGITPEILSQAFATAGADWFAHNPIDAPSAAVACVIAVAAPETVVAVEACASSVGTIAADLAAAYLTAVVKAVPTLSDDEKTQLVTALGLGNLAIDTAIAGGVRDRIITFVEGGADQLFNKDNSRVGVKIGVDFAKKYLFIFDLKP